MNLEQEEDIALLRDAARDCLASISSDPLKAWSELADQLGLFELAETDSDWGARRHEAIAAIFEVAGAALCPLPLLDTLVVAPLLLEGSVLSRLKSGAVRAGFAWREAAGDAFSAVPATTLHAAGEGFALSGAKLAVSSELPPTHLLVTASGPGDGESGLTIILVEAGARGVTMSGYRGFDGRRLVDVHFDAVTVEATAVLHSGEAGRALAELALDHAAAATCAEAVGVLRKLLLQTTAYVTERKQFGRPLSDFQVLQHRLADMLAQVELSDSASLRATLSLATDDLRSASVSAAKVVVGRACKFVGENAIQLHGGMGMSEETPVGGYFKRALVLAHQFGSPDQHLRRLAGSGAIRPFVAIA